jgi:hypothetical protein
LPVSSKPVPYAIIRQKQPPLLQICVRAADWGVDREIEGGLKTGQPAGCPFREDRLRKRKMHRFMLLQSR